MTTFHTPKGRPVEMTVRENTSDWNTVRSCLDDDEYGLGELDLHGEAIDIGAHIGGATIALLVDNPDLHVTAIEPIPDNCALIDQNARQNGVSDRLTVIQGAAGYRKGEQRIHYGYTGDETHRHHAFIGNISLIQGGGPTSCPDDTPHEHVTVPTIALSKLPAASFIKIDCEGGEWEFLRGSLKAVTKVRGEWHPTDGHTQADLTKLLGDFDIAYTGVPEQTDATTWMGFRAVRR